MPANADIISPLFVNDEFVHSQRGGVSRDHFHVDGRDASEEMIACELEQNTSTSLLDTKNAARTSCALHSCKLAFTFTFIAASSNHVPQLPANTIIWQHTDHRPTMSLASTTAATTATTAACIAAAALIVASQHRCSSALVTDFEPNWY
jgi:hypothetical protein